MNFEFTKVLQLTPKSMPAIKLGPMLFGNCIGNDDQQQGARRGSSGCPGDNRPLMNFLTHKPDGFNHHCNLKISSIRCTAVVIDGMNRGMKSHGDAGKEVRGGYDG